MKLIGELSKNKQRLVMMSVIMLALEADAIDGEEVDRAILDLRNLPDGERYVYASTLAEEIAVVAKNCTWMQVRDFIDRWEDQHNVDYPPPATRRMLARLILYSNTRKQTIQIAEGWLQDERL